MDALMKKTNTRVLAILKEDMDVIYAIWDSQDDDEETLREKLDDLRAEMRRLGLAVELC